MHFVAQFFESITQGPPLTRRACAARVTVVVVCGLSVSVRYPTSHFTSHASLHKRRVYVEKYVGFL